MHTSSSQLQFAKDAAWHGVGAACGVGGAGTLSSGAGRREYVDDVPVMGFRFGRMLGKSSTVLPSTSEMEMTDIESRSSNQNDRMVRHEAPTRMTSEESNEKASMDSLHRVLGGICATHSRDTIVWAFSVVLSVVSVCVICLTCASCVDNIKLSRHDF